MAHEQDLRKIARELSGLYLTMEAMKFGHGVRPEAQSQKPAPGPQTPGNLTFIDRYAQVERELVPIAVQALKKAGADFIEGDRVPFRLCYRVAWYAQPISELDISDDLMAIMSKQHNRITYWCYPQDLGQQLQKEQPWLTARTICYSLKQQGHTVTPALLRKWVERGKLESRTTLSNKTTYPLLQVKRLLEK